MNIPLSIINNYLKTGRLQLVVKEAFPYTNFCKMCHDVIDEKEFYCDNCKNIMGLNSLFKENNNQEVSNPQKIKMHYMGGFKK